MTDTKTPDAPEAIKVLPDGVFDVLNQVGFQHDVQEWLQECSNHEVVWSRQERAVRFMEESRDECHERRP